LLYPMHTQIIAGHKRNNPNCPFFNAATGVEVEPGCEDEELDDGPELSTVEPREEKVRADDAPTESGTDEEEEREKREEKEEEQQEVPPAVYQSSFPPPPSTTPNPTLHLRRSRRRMLGRRGGGQLHP
jgi:hypothetical protein